VRGRMSTTEDLRVMGAPSQVEVDRLEAIDEAQEEREVVSVGARERSHRCELEAEEEILAELNTSEDEPEGEDEAQS